MGPIAGVGKGDVASAKTLGGLLADRRLRDGQRRALVVIHDDGSQEALTFGDLLEDSARIAHGLRRAGAAGGDLVMLLLPHGREVFTLFWGAILAGCGVSIYPPPPPRADPRAHGRQLAAVAGGSRVRLLVTTARWAGALPEMGSPTEILTVDDVQGLSRGSGAWEQLPARHGTDLAVLLHTSGSSGPPKPIAFSDRQLLDHSAALAGAVAARPDDVIVSWLPLHHDMGLHAALALPMAARLEAVVMSPEYWIHRPGHLLRAVHEHRGTLTWMPNFAFNHSVRRIPEKEVEGLDLSSWRLLVDAAEPVRAESQDRLLARFAHRGLRSTALATGYGMTEVGGISISPPGRRARIDWISRDVLQAERRAAPVSRDDPTALAVVSCGVPMPGLEARVVDAQGAELEDRQLGEIEVRSPFVFHGYHRRPDLSKGVLSKDRWFRTGDLGYRAGGELFVCGRKSDVIISGGLNVNPQDVEAIASQVEGVKPGRAVALGVQDPTQGTEGIVVVCERSGPEDDDLNVERRLRRRVAGELGLALARVRVEGPGWVIKTPAGKVSRKANRKKHLDSIRVAEGGSAE